MLGRTGTVLIFIVDYVNRIEKVTEAWSILPEV